ncbi:trans-aconitate 2-methyltransferase [Bailinhaonella thermotolerans]|uniref:Trans-aconitate 2-methyltransferase n=1 Tax=Bailinhaonella thermotolerans TaxID=1070861 RepID=A0A3A4AUD8_9ACTN|nr:trans-aconitate 2-methyltransferase [Bailinhaonella thermotolerans]RJL33610.1 trans-aconitate 2-methyltransferase [Bailinhaonella thermotolerans]
MWDPTQYGRYADERSRPFFDLIARVRAEKPRRVADLGCGSGELTATLAERWPDAVVTGLDSSEAMIAKAVAANPGVEFAVADLRDWQPEPDTDVVVSSAVFQWVPGHRELLVDWAERLPAGAWLAFQVPGNFAAPSHEAIRRVCASPRWTVVADVPRPDPVSSPAEYLDLLTACGLDVEAWETTYLHVLPGDDPVLEWVKGTALRPILDRLPDPEERAAFLADLGARLREAYPRKPYGTVFPFRRVFVVARKP